MPQKILLLTITILSFHISLSQNGVEAKDNPATAVWDFIAENYALSGIAKVQIAKTGKVGNLKLEVATTNESFYIGGTVYIYLFDNSVITCIDKGSRHKTETGTAAWYSFSTAEMIKLSKIDIQSVRFTIKGTPTKFNSQVGNFTAVNKKTYFSGFGEEEKNYYLTAAEIAALK